MVRPARSFSQQPALVRALALDDRDVPVPPEATVAYRRSTQGGLSPRRSTSACLVECRHPGTQVAEAHGWSTAGRLGVSWLMASALTTGGYSVEDLGWLRDELGIAHLELDPWGSLIVSPATDEHETGVAVLHEQVVWQLTLPPGSVRSNGLAWKVPGASGYVNVPDLAVVAPGWKRIDDLHIAPPPLLVVEVGSPSTRSVDRSRKMNDYRLGGAGLYLLVDLPESGSVNEVGFEAHDFVAGKTATATGVIDMVVADQPLQLDLTQFPKPSV